MGTFFSEITTTLKNEKERFRNRDFLKATMAASALLALADGKVTISEQLARDYILENIRDRKNLSSTESEYLGSHLYQSLRIKRIYDVQSDNNASDYPLEPSRSPPWI